MRYLGGKARIRKYIIEYLQSLCIKRDGYFEPFCGAAWVMPNYSGVRYATDGCDPLIAMFQALQQGWIPPNECSEDEYEFWKHSNDFMNPMKAFVGFGCSFSGKWYAGYARSNGRNYCLNAKNSLLKKIRRLQDVHFCYGGYEKYNPTGLLIYCDPPYRKSTQYSYFKEPFDHDKFFDTMREWAKHNTVIISEYSAPGDFTCLLEIPTKLDMHTLNENTRIEKLFAPRDYNVFRT